MTDFAALAADLDAQDTLKDFRDLFHVPQGTIYLDGNSLGLMPKAVPQRLADVMEREWSEGLISSWEGAGWFDLPMNVGNRLAPIIGAGKNEVAVGDSTSVNLYKCLAAALALQPSRSVILAEHSNFPTDNYIIQGALPQRSDLRVVYFDSLDELIAGLSEDVAVVVLSHVHYRTASIFDMASVNDAAHRFGVLTLWDLSHSTGAVPVDLKGTKADFAVGCTYKYVNGGPGAPAFCWAHPDIVARTSQPLSGWMGHASPFDFTLAYNPGTGSRRFVCGTPQILSLSSLDEALKIWEDVNMAHLRSKSQRMTSFFIDAVEAECAEFGLKLQVPRNETQRGSHVSFGLAYGYPVMKALAAHRVIGDFRAPDTMRFGFAPLYLRFSDVYRAVEILRDILQRQLWKAPEYSMKSVVT